MSLLRPRRRESIDELYGLTEAEMNTLATYNSEINRGVMHTEEWRAAMRELQRRYDENRRARLSTDVRMSPAAMDRIQRDWHAK
jgi:hypothetical protein